MIRFLEFLSSWGGVKRDVVFLILSGAATGASWLCYFKALQTGDINKVVPIDKSSTVLTILLALIFLQEGISIPKAAAVIVIAAGIFLMIEKKDVEIKASRGGAGWILYAAGSAVFASLTAILGKVGISGVESNLGTAIRTCVVLVMAWLMVGIRKKQQEVRQIPKIELIFICCSGIATGKEDREKGIGLYLSFRNCHRGILAFLLPGSSGRPGQYCGSC